MAIVAYQPSGYLPNNEPRIQNGPERDCLSRSLEVGDRLVERSINHLIAFDTGVQNRIDQLIIRNRVLGCCAGAFYFPHYIRITYRVINEVQELYNIANFIERFAMVAGSSLGIGILIGMHAAVQSLLQSDATSSGYV